MKIINKGDRKRALPWWTRVVWKCGKCGFSAEFEESDTLLVHVHSDQREGDWATTTCPTCGTIISVSPQSYTTDQWGR